MKNREYFGNKTLNEAIAKYESDLAYGWDCDWSAWLESSYADLAKGRFSRGAFYAQEDTEEKIRKMEAVEVTGYLLKWQNKAGQWFASEFDPEKGTDSNIWCNDSMREACNDWFDNEVFVGFFKELGEAWFESSDDWDFRLGVDFDARTTPTENPKADGIWEGIAAPERGFGGEHWRVRKVTIKGELSDNAKAFMRRNPDVWFAYAQ